MPANYRFPASYLYLLRLSRTELEAEFRRRKFDEKARSFRAHGDPFTPALPDEDTDVALTVVSTHVHHSGNRHSSFDLWRVACYRSLEHQGNRLRLAAEESPGTVRIDLPAAIGHGDLLAILLPCGHAFGQSAHIAARANAVLSGRRTARGRSWRPPPQRLLLVRALIALDAHLAGASYREIAAVVFGSQTVGQRWSHDTTLKEQTRYLVRKARDLMNRPTSLM